MIYLQILWAFIKIGLFSIGGGYASLPLIEQIIINQYHWISIDDFSNIITLSQMTPGPIAINAATFVGNQIAGILGAIVASIGVCIPGLIIVLLLSYIYRKYHKQSLLMAILAGLRMAVIILIASAAITIIKQGLLIDGQNFSIIASIIMVISFILIRKYQLKPIMVMVICGIVGMLVF